MWCLKCVIVYLSRDIRPFVMYCVNGKPRSSLLIQSTDSMITRNRSLSNIGRARCAAINSDFFKIIISKYINYTIGINDNNCVFVCNLILGW